MESTNVIVSTTSALARSRHRFHCVESTLRFQWSRRTERFLWI